MTAYIQHQHGQAQALAHIASSTSSRAFSYVPLALFTVFMEIWGRESGLG